MSAALALDVHRKAQWLHGRDSLPRFTTDGLALLHAVWACASSDYERAIELPDGEEWPVAPAWVLCDRYGLWSLAERRACAQFN